MAGVVQSFGGMQGREEVCSIAGNIVGQGRNRDLEIDGLDDRKGGGSQLGNGRL